MGRILSTIAILVVVWAAKFGFNAVTAEPVPSAGQDTATSAEWIADDNAWVEQELRDGTAEPARGWLDRPDHGTFEANPQQLDALIDEFHAAGAVDVWMVGIEPFAGHRLADSIAVELPADPDMRAEIFAIEAGLWGGEGTPDMGQRYLTVSLD